MSEDGPAAGVVGGIVVVFRHSVDASIANEALQRRLKRVGALLRIERLAGDMDGEGLQVLRLLCGVFDRDLRPFVERKFFGAFLFSLTDIFGECIELAFERRAVFRQCFHEGLRQIVGSAARRFRTCLGEMDADLVVCNENYIRT